MKGWLIQHIFWQAALHSVYNSNHLSLQHRPVLFNLSHIYYIILQYEDCASYLRGLSRCFDSTCHVRSYG